MFFNFNSIVFNDLIATNTTNYHEPTDLEMDEGIQPNTDLNSELVNSFLYKCSSAIKQIQENGAISYIPNKVYNKGNIVKCNVVINNTISVYIFMSKIDNNTDAPLDGLVSNDSEGFVYFTSDKMNNNWDKIYSKNNIEISYELDDFKLVGKETVNDHFKFIKLFDITSEVSRNNKNSTFRLNISRGNSFLTANINIVYNDTDCNIYIDNVLCNNYSLDSSSSIWNFNSIFKDFALLGSFLYIDRNNNPIICFCPRNGNVSILDSKIKIQIFEIKGNIKFNLSEDPTQIILDNNIKKVPFISSASSIYRSSKEICDLFEELNYIEKYKRGLILLDVDNVDKLVYYAFKDIDNSSITNFKGRYTSTVPYSNYTINNPIYKSKIDSIDLIKPQFSGTVVQISPESYNNNRDYKSGNTQDGSGIWSFTNSDYYNLRNLFPSTNSTNLTWGPGGFETGSSPRYFVKFNASNSNSKYSDSISNDFELDSTKVYKYICFI